MLAVMNADEGEGAGRAAQRSVVLLVDDEQLVLSSLERSLRGVPVSIQRAGSAEEALAWICAGGRPAAVITDLRMSGLDGLALLREVSLAAPLAHCALHTGDARLEVDLVSGRALTIFAKPVAPELVRRFVLAAIDR